MISLTNSERSIEPLSQGWRVVALGVNVLLAWILFYFATGDKIPTGSGASVWFLAATAYWLLTLVAAPFFIPPRDSLSTTIAVVLLLAPLDFSSVVNFQSALILTNTITILLALFVGTIAVISIFKQKDRAGKVPYRLSSLLGKGEVLFTPVVIISALGFYQTNPGWMATILALWTFILAVHPVEMLIQIGLYLREFKKQVTSSVLAGTILRIDDPNIVRVSLSRGFIGWLPGNTYIANLFNGKTTYILPLFSQIQNDEMIGTGIFCDVKDEELTCTTEIGEVYGVNVEGLADRLGGTLSGEEGINKIVGIIVEGSSISSINFQVVRGSTPLEEGTVVFSYIRGKKVYYQILDAKTNEENFQQNPYGVHIASASQLGCYDTKDGFEKFPWLPEMNQPLFLVSQEYAPKPILSENEFVIGKVPSTSLNVAVILDDLIEYHTAILGKTGTAKTELAFDIVREALKRNTKIFCVDFTGEYKKRLSDCNPELIGLDEADEKKMARLLFEIDAYGFKAEAQKAELKKIVDEKIRPEVAQKIENFLKKDESSLGIFELAEMTNTGSTLRVTELYLSAIMNWARKNRKKRRILIVLEEAHTIIPEAYGSAFDSGTKWVVERIGQIALQGRKYGVGLLLISQRTALVSKTVLSQCHTYFSHELIDKTSLDYLSNILAPEHLRALPNLKFLRLIAYGKGVKSERPIVIERAYDPEKKAASKALDVDRIEVETQIKPILKS